MNKSHSIQDKKIFSAILGSSVYKGLNIIISLLIVRFSIQVIGEEQYGIWLALLAVFTWFSALEVGITSGIRNQITVLWADQGFETIKHYLAKGYRSLLKVYFSIISLLLIASFFLPISSFILPEDYNSNSFDLTLRICVLLYFLHFVFFFLHAILLAVHKTKETYLIILIQNTFVLLGLIFAKYSDFSVNIHLFCIWLSIVPLLTWGGANLVFFKRELNQISPFTLSKSTLKTPSIKGLQLKFFVIQLCNLVIFSTDHIIIINFIGSIEVTAYAISFKYFNILIVVFNLILLPYWSSFADAYHRKDKTWIVSQFKKLLIIWCVLALGGFLMLLFSDYAYSIWIGKSISTSFILSLFMFISILLTIWNSLFAYFLNSISKVNLQLKLLLLSATVNIPLSILLIDYVQSAGVIIATCISLLLLSIALPIQCYKELKTQ